MAYTKAMPRFQDIVNKKQKGTTFLKQTPWPGLELTLTACSPALQKGWPQTTMAHVIHSSKRLTVMPGFKCKKQEMKDSWKHNVCIRLYVGSF